MKNKMPKYSYVEWLSAEEMHEIIKQWISELKFIQDEQLFLNVLVESHTHQLIDSTVFEESKKTIAKLKIAENDIVPLLKMVQIHENQLGIMIDAIDQFKMEKAYLETHKELLIAMNSYTQKYREVKEELFKIVSFAMKKEKRLLR